MAFSMFATAVALPSIMNVLDGDVTTTHWVMTGFQIARTVPMPTMGWLSSLVGRIGISVRPGNAGQLGLEDAMPS
jgi:MFS family permease